jgi:hypothetical protein
LLIENALEDSATFRHIKQFEKQTEETSTWQRSDALILIGAQGETDAETTIPFMQPTEGSREEPEVSEGHSSSGGKIG